MMCGCGSVAFETNFFFLGSACDLGEDCNGL